MQSSGQNCLRVDPALAGIRISAAGVAWLAVSTDRHGFNGGHIERTIGQSAGLPTGQRSQYRVVGPGRSVPTSDHGVGARVVTDQARLVPTIGS